MASAGDESAPGCAGSEGSAGRRVLLGGCCERALRARRGTAEAADAGAGSALHCQEDMGSVQCCGGKVWTLTSEAGPSNECLLTSRHEHGEWNAVVQLRDTAGASHPMSLRCAHEIAAVSIPQGELLSGSRSKSCNAALVFDKLSP